MLKWFKEISLANKLAFVGVTVAIISLIFSILPISEEKKAQLPTTQESEGNNSPNVKTDSDVNITY